MAKILVTDDEPSERLWLQSLLESDGHEILFAADGEIALEQFDEGGIDLVITDLVMPNLNGFRLIEDIRKRDADVGILAITGKSPEHLHIADEFGATATLVKPVAAQEVRAAVNEALGIETPAGESGADPGSGDEGSDTSGSETEKDWNPEEWFGM